jgi:hypothetical protein
MTSEHEPHCSRRVPLLGTLKSVSSWTSFRQLEQMTNGDPRRTGRQWCLGGGRRFISMAGGLCIAGSWLQDL